MRLAILSAALVATAFGAIPAAAQDNPREARREYRDEVRDARKDYRKDVRNARLRECVDIMRALFAGEEVSHDGLVTVDRARLWTLPSTPPPMIGAAVSIERHEPRLVPRMPIDV